MTLLIQTDFVSYYVTAPAASPKTQSNYPQGAQTFLETNNLSANAETLDRWALLHHGGGELTFQLVKKFKHSNCFRKCISVHKISPLSLIRSQLNPLHNFVFINTEFHVNPPCMP
jgi:hypothetical protein